MNRNLYLFIFIFSLFFSVDSQAEIKLPAIFGDHMVLQQQTGAALWGKSAENKTVKVVTSWDRKSYSTRSDADGNWKIVVNTPVAGGPYSVSISDGKTLVLNDVLIGEV